MSNLPFSLPADRAAVARESFSVVELVEDARATSARAYDPSIVYVDYNSRPAPVLAVSHSVILDLLSRVSLSWRGAIVLVASVIVATSAFCIFFLPRL